MPTLVIRKGTLRSFIHAANLVKVLLASFERLILRVNSTHNYVSLLWLTELGMGDHQQAPLSTHHLSQRLDASCLTG